MSSIYVETHICSPMDFQKEAVVFIVIVLVVILHADLRYLDICDKLFV